MNIVSTLLPTKEIENQLKIEFPNENFHFYKGMKNILHLLPEADVLITYGEDLTPELIQQANHLKWIMVMSAGMEKMPFKAIKNKGILVTNVRGIHKIPMGEYVISMMLQVSRQAKVLFNNEKNRIWDRKVRVNELHGKTIGILGVGAIGGEIARLAKAFHMRTLGVNRSGRDVEYVDKVYTTDQIDIVLRESDYIVSVLPSTPETKYLLKEEHFDLMKNTAVFINIGRGDVVKEEVLIQALKESKISHAVLDVFEQEPLPSDHIFWQMENVTVTPHLSGITKNYLPRAFEIFIHNLHIFKQGQGDYLNVVNLDRGY
jgi:phosphoglycerate dehydrogenase-like enzyme